MTSIVAPSDQAERRKPMTLITDHLFRHSGEVGGIQIDRGMCCYMTSCNRPREQHITRTDFRKRAAKP